MAVRHDVMLECSRAMEKWIIPIVFGDNKASFQLVRGLKYRMDLARRCALNHTLDKTRKDNLTQT